MVVQNTQRRTLLTAHSGPDGTADNSLENITYVLETTADAMELDLRRNNEGEIVLAHDPVGDGAPSLTLRRAFQIISEHPTMKINCDLKEGNLEREVYELGLNYELQDRLIYSGAADPSNCEDLPVTLYLNLEYFLEPSRDSSERIRQLEESSQDEVRDFLFSCLENLPQLGAHSLNMHYSVFDKAFRETDDASSLAFSLWTVDEPEYLKRYIQTGVQAITTRQLKTALDLRDSL